MTARERAEVYLSGLLGAPGYEKELHSKAVGVLAKEFDAHAKEVRAEGFKSGLMTAKNCWAPDWPDYLDNLQRKADNRADT